VLRRIAGGVGPVVGVGVSESHVARAEAVEGAEDLDGVLDGVAPLDADEDGAMAAATMPRMSEVEPAKRTTRD